MRLNHPKTIPTTPLLRGKIVFHETSPWCKKVGDCYSKGRTVWDPPARAFTPVMTTPGLAALSRKVFYKRTCSLTLGVPTNLGVTICQCLSTFSHWKNVLVQPSLTKDIYLFRSFPHPNFFLSKLYNPSRDEPLPKIAFQTGLFVHQWMGDYLNQHTSSPTDCSFACLCPQPYHSMKPNQYITSSHSTHPHNWWV